MTRSSIWELIKEASSRGLYQTYNMILVWKFVLIALVFAKSHEEDSEVGADHTEAGNPERNSNQSTDVSRVCLSSAFSEGSCLCVSKLNGSNDGPDEGFEEISSHTGDITDVVTNVVCLKCKT